MIDSSTLPSSSTELVYAKHCSNVLTDLCGAPGCPAYKYARVQDFFIGQLINRVSGGPLAQPFDYVIGPGRYLSKAKFNSHVSTSPYLKYIPSLTIHWRCLLQGSSTILK